MGSIHHAAEIIYMCIHSSEEIIYTAECSKVMGNMQICLRFDQVLLMNGVNPVLRLESSLMTTWHRYLGN